MGPPDGETQRTGDFPAGWDIDGLLGRYCIFYTRSASEGNQSLNFIFLQLWFSENCSNITAVWYRGVFGGAINWSPVIPKGVSLSDSRLEFLQSHIANMMGYAAKERHVATSHSNSGKLTHQISCFFYIYVR